MVGCDAGRDIALDLFTLQLFLYIVRNLLGNLELEAVVVDVQLEARLFLGGAFVASFDRFIFRERVLLSRHLKWCVEFKNFCLRQILQLLLHRLLEQFRREREAPLRPARVTRLLLLDL